jgi:hypothetical protein
MNRREVVKALAAAIVIELDAVPDRARTPKESAEINRRYLSCEE